MKKVKKIQQGKTKKKNFFERLSQDFEKFLSKVRELSECERYKLLTLVEKTISKEKDNLKEKLINEVQEKGVKTDKGYILKKNNFLVELFTVPVNRIDTKKLKTEMPEIAQKFTVTGQRKILEVREIIEDKKVIHLYFSKTK